MFLAACAVPQAALAADLIVVTNQGAMPAFKELAAAFRAPAGTR
jgi:hypothetical protein